MDLRFTALDQCEVKYKISLGHFYLNSSVFHYAENVQYLFSLYIISIFRLMFSQMSFFRTRQTDPFDDVQKTVVILLNVTLYNPLCDT